MKPLELVIHPPLPFSVRMAIRSAEASPVPHVPVFHTIPPGLSEMKAKRLTNAELAAECWAMMSDWQMAHIDQEPTDKYRARCDALHRFATLPSYDEVPE